MNFVSPVLDFQRDKSLDIPYNFSKNNGNSSVGIDVDTNYNPFEHPGKNKSFIKKALLTTNPGVLSNNYTVTLSRTPLLGGIEPLGGMRVAEIRNPPRLKTDTSRGDRNL